MPRTSDSAIPGLFSLDRMYIQPRMASGTRLKRAYHAWMTHGQARFFPSDAMNALTE